MDIYDTLKKKNARIIEKLNKLLATTGQQSNEREALVKDLAMQIKEKEGLIKKIEKGMVPEDSVRKKIENALSVKLTESADLDIKSGQRGGIKPTLGDVMKIKKGK